MMTTRKIGSIVYTEYIVKAGETTVQQIARDHLQEEGRFKEIKQWQNNTFNEITTTLQPGWVLLLPPVSDIVLTFRNTSLGGDRVFSGPGLNFSELYTAQINTEFHYKKSSLTSDLNGCLWVRAVSAGHPEGYICVKKGKAHYTNPVIDG
jgi:hypothetical protein